MINNMCNDIRAFSHTSVDRAPCHPVRPSLVTFAVFQKFQHEAQQMITSTTSGGIGRSLGFTGQSYDAYPWESVIAINAYIRMMA